MDPAIKVDASEFQVVRDEAFHHLLRWVFKESGTMTDELRDHLHFLGRVGKGKPDLKQSWDIQLEVSRRLWPASFDGLVGTSLGRWRLTQKLGNDDASSLYEASSEGEPALVRLFRPRCDQVTLSILISAYRKLKHPGIRRVLDHGEEGGMTFLVEERLRASALGAVIPERGMVLGLAMGYARSLVDSLHCLHERGLVHGALGPHSVVVASGGRVVLEFPAHQVAPAAIRDALMYIPMDLASRAVSPESLSGGRSSPASDQYGVGCLLFEMLTGKPPYHDRRGVEKALGHLSEPPPDPRDLKADVPEAVAAVILRCLEKEPGRRFPDVAELARALDRAACRGGGD